MHLRHGVSDNINATSFPGPLLIFPPWVRGWTNAAELFHLSQFRVQYVCCSRGLFAILTWDPSCSCPYTMSHNYGHSGNSIEQLLLLPTSYPPRVFVPLDQRSGNKRPWKDPIRSPNIWDCWLKYACLACLKRDVSVLLLALRRTRVRYPLCNYTRCANFKSQ